MVPIKAREPCFQIVAGGPHVDEVRIYNFTITSMYSVNY